MGAFGNRTILPAIGLIAVLAGSMVFALRSRRGKGPGVAAVVREDHTRTSLTVVGLVMLIWVLLQATNSAAVVVMTLLVTRRLHQPVLLAGVALGVAAGLEVPSLLWLGRLSARVSTIRLVVSGCLAGIAYYLAMGFASGPIVLIGLQVLNAWFYAVVAGVGLTWFQELIPRAGLASGVFANTSRLGAIVGGLIISLGSASRFSYSGIFLVGSAVTLLALAMVPLVNRAGKRAASRLAGPAVGEFGSSGQGA